MRRRHHSGAVRVAMFPPVESASNQYLPLLAGAVGDAGVDVILGTASLRRPPDVLHIHWPFPSMRNGSRTRAMGKSILRLAWFLLMRLRGSALVYTVHNARSHDSLYPALEKMVSGVLWRSLDSVTVMSNASLSELAAMRLRKGVPCSVIRHGHYATAHKTVAMREARNAVGIAESGTVVGFAGRVEQYKGLDELIDAFRTASLDDVSLLIAGKPDEQTGSYIQEVGGSHPRIHLILKWLEDDELVHAVCASNLLVVPNRNALNSGAILLGLSLGVPVVARRTEGFAELQGLIGDGWLRLFDGLFDEQELKHSIEWARHRKGGPDLSPFDWTKIGEQTARLYGLAIAYRQDDIGDATSQIVD